MKKLTPSADRLGAALMQDASKPKETVVETDMDLIEPERPLTWEELYDLSGGGK